MASQAQPSQTAAASWLTGGNLVFKAGRTAPVCVRATDGEPLWAIRRRHRIMAPPVTYTADGVQYVTGWWLGGASGLMMRPHWARRNRLGRILTFALNGHCHPTNTAIWTQDPPSTGHHHEPESADSA